MGYIREHFFDNVLFSSQLNLKTSGMDRIRKEMRKDKITVRRGGSIVTLTADARNQKNAGFKALGFGSQNIVLDDSPLLSDAKYAYVKRMVGGRKDTFIVETGNPVVRNHFYRTMKSARYKQIWIDYKTALKEGRFSDEFISEAREEQFFDILYECKFPASDVMDEKGYMFLFSDALLNDCFIDVDKLPTEKKRELKTGRGRLGCDVSEGRANNVCFGRWNSFGEILHRDKEKNTARTGDNIVRVCLENDIAMEDAFLDDTGVGSGLFDSMRRDKKNINGIKFGEKAHNEADFANVKAELYWDMRKWLMAGGRIAYDEKIETQMQECKYRLDDRKVQMEPKTQMRLRGVASPDELDAAVLSFGRRAAMLINQAKPKDAAATGEKVDAGGQTAQKTQQQIDEGAKKINEAIGRNVMRSMRSFIRR